MHTSYYEYPSTEWSTQDVVDKYLKPTGFEHLAKVFSEQHINGAVLLALEVWYISGNRCMACV